MGYNKKAKCFDELSDQDKTFILTYVSNGFQQMPAYELTHPNAGPSARQSCTKYKKALQPYIDEFLKDRYEELQISADHVLMALAEIGFAAKNDEIYNVQAKLKALDLMQKQMGLQTKNVKAEAEVKAAVTFVDDLKPDEDKTE